MLKHSSKNAEWWEGICHGWALASSLHEEPDKIVLENPDGIDVPFGSSDVKALLSMYYAYSANGSMAVVGEKCSVRGKVDGEAFPEDGIKPFPKFKDANVPSCKDTNAGSFHIILANMIGNFSSSFILDVDRFNDIWNQPVVSYTSQIINDTNVKKWNPFQKVHRKVHVKTRINYADELELYSEEEVLKGTLGFISKEPVTGTVHQTFDHKDYEYTLELDKNGNIIGGEWISESRPDFIWMMTKSNSFKTDNSIVNPFKKRFDFSDLQNIYVPLKN